MLNPTLNANLQMVGEIPPAAQLPLILWRQPKRRIRRRRGRFLHWPEEKPGIRLFNANGYSSVALGRC